MALRKIRMICALGDKTLGEWETDKLSPEKLRELEAEFNAKMQQGFFAADITDGRNVFVKKFDPNADTLLIPPVQGG
jgi:hypothetical protein